MIQIWALGSMPSFIWKVPFLHVTQLGFGIYKSVKIGSLTVQTNPDADDTSDMIKLHDISYSVEGRPLLENASATIPAGHKVGLVGRNGTGKTTLFRLIRGELSLETGSIDLPRQARIGGVAQEVPGNDISLLDTVLAADTERAELLAEAERADDPNRVAGI